MAEKLSPTDAEIEESKITTANNNEYLVLPDNLLRAQILSRNCTIHKGMEMVENSLKVHRSCNEAIIFVYGMSGAGKTTSLNHLFGFDIIKVSDEKASDTKLVTEYIATMDSEDWKVSNLQIGFIDMPGWDDDTGEEQDILNMATIDKFISNHPYLGSNVYKCYPSVVMIAIDANDKRLQGENAHVVRMFRALNKLRIIDEERSNLLIVLTHVMNVRKINFKENINRIIIILKEHSLKYLNTEASVVYLENDIEHHELEKEGDWTILRDGTLQPKNVFEEMMQLTDKHKDEVGHEAIRLYFASKGVNKPVIKKQLGQDKLMEYEIRKWRSIIAQEFDNAPRNEVSQALQTYAHKHPDVCTERSLITLMIELNARLLTTLADLHSMTLNQVQERLTPYHLTQIENQSLVEGCGVKPYQFPDILQDIGYGMNAETRERTHSPILELSTECHVQRGVKLPKSMHVLNPIEKRRVEWTRLSESNFVQDNLTGQMLSPTTPTEIHVVKYQFQIVYSIYTVKLSLSDDQLLVSQLSAGFKEAVTALPESSIGEGSQVRREYVDFLNKYGHWVIVGCECGGWVEGELEMEEREATHLQKHFSLYINSLLERLESDDDTASLPITSETHEAEQMFDSIGRQMLNWRGGDNPGNLTLRTLTPQIWKRWIASLYGKPVALDHNGSNNSMQLQTYQFISLMDQPKCLQLQKMLHTLYLEVEPGPLRTKRVGSISLECEGYSINITEEQTREGTSKQHLSKTLNKASRGFPGDSICIRGNFDDFSRVQIKDIVESDQILACKDPWWIHFVNRKVIAREEGKLFEYIKITHEHGEITLGHSETVLVRIQNQYPKMIAAKNIGLGDKLYYIDLKKKQTLGSKVKGVMVIEKRGNYFFKKGGISMIAVNQVVTGDEETACFPGNASVELRGGERVRMDALKIGDYVLSIHPTTGKPVYSRVYLWAHRDPHITATFLHITHPHGHLHISAHHLILSGDQRRPVPADQLRVGDSIHFLSPCLSKQEKEGEGEGEERGDSHTLISVPVLHIQTCTQVGYYAPFTNNGLIVVDGIAASVYTNLSTHSQSDSSSSSSCWLWSGVWHSVTSGLVQQFGMQRVGQCVLTPVRVGCKLGMGSVLSQQMDTNAHIHKYCQWLLNVYKNSYI